MQPHLPLCHSCDEKATNVTAYEPCRHQILTSLIVLMPKYAWTLTAKKRHADLTEELVTLIASSSPPRCSFSNFTPALKFASLNIYKLVIAISPFMVEPHLSTIGFPLSGNGTNSTGSSDKTAHDE
jgi:hypothetical protein